MAHEKLDCYVLYMGSINCTIYIYKRQDTKLVGRKKAWIRGVWEGVNMINTYEMSKELIIMRKYFITFIKIHKVTFVDKIDISSNFLLLV